MKVLYVATVASHICQFHLPYLEMLKAQGYEVSVAARDNLAEKNGLALKFTDKYYNIPFQRSPKDRRNVSAYKQLREIIKNNYFDLIVCNTPIGGILTRLAAKKTRKNGTRVIYIAHGFHFYNGAPKKYWLTFYPIEKFFAKFCDMVITINEEDYLCAKKSFKTDVRHIHGIGVSSDRYSPADEVTKNNFRKELNLSYDDYVILCTGELNKNKNQSQLISASSLIKDKIPNLKVLLAGNGPNEQNLLEQIEDLNLKNTIKLLGYRTDLEKIIPAVDLVVSCSIREGLGLNIIEAMICAKPIVATRNRGHNELINNDVNGLLVSHDSANEMAEAIYEIYNNPNKADMFSENNKNIAQKYTVDGVKKELFDLLV